SSTVTFIEHGPPQRPIWPGKHGRPEAIAFLYDASLQVRIGNTLIIRSMVSCTAQTLGYGPKYFAPAILRLRVTMTRGASSPRVTAMYGYDLSSLYRTLNGGENSWIHMYSSCSESTSVSTTVHSTDAAVVTMRRVRSCRVCSGAK